jgi:hypothetical protein
MKSVLLSVTITLCAAAMAQPKGNIKLYGYEQYVSSGRAPDINPQTGLPTSSGAGKNYYLYAVSTSRIYPSELWIAGKKFGVTVNTLTQTPVEYSDETIAGLPKKLLVPKTDHYVIQLIPSLSIEAKSGGGNEAKNQAALNSLVLVYKQNGKFYYSALKSLALLDRASAQ